MGGDYFALCLALEELARVDSSVAITLEAGVSLGAMPIYRFGTAEQRDRWLPELCTGERLAAFGLTEPGGGSDIPGGMRTTARLEEGPEGGEWVVNGTKAFITNSGTSITSLVTVLAITGRGEGGRKEISSIIVPAGTPGFVPGPEYSKVGWCASDTRELSLRPSSLRPVMASTVTSDVMAVPELVMKALLPSTTHSPSSSRAVVRIPPGMSDPPPGSVRPNAASRSPVHSSGSHRSRCRAVPNR